LEQHEDKVQTLEWHPYEKQTLLTGSSDKTVRVFDCNSGDCKVYNIGEEAEVVTWDTFNPYNFIVGTDTGQVLYYDARSADVVWKLSAHTEPVTGLSLSSQCPGCLVSVSEDKTLKVWDISNKQPDFIVSRDFKMGKVFMSRFAPDAPFVIALGGEKSNDKFKVWDIRNSAAVNNKFKHRKLLTTETEDMAS